MEDKHLIQICLMGTLGAILLLSFIGEVVPRTRIMIEEISRQDIERGVYVEGVIDKIGVKGETTFFTVKDETGVIQGVIFGKVSLRKGQNVGITGKVQRYKGDLELIAEEVRRI